MNETPATPSAAAALTESARPRIAIISGSTRPGRKSAVISDWVHEHAARRADADFEIVDLLDFNLPLLDEAMPPIMGQYEHPHTKAFAAKIDSFDGFVFVAPEYNHSISGALKNAIDYLYAEWTNKAAGFVGYGAQSGFRAVEHLRQILAELQVAGVRGQVSLSLYTDFVDFQDFKPLAHKTADLTAMLDQLVSWTTALRTVRG